MSTNDTARLRKLQMLAALSAAVAATCPTAAMGQVAATAAERAASICSLRWREVSFVDMLVLREFRARERLWGGDAGFDSEEGAPRF